MSVDLGSAHGSIVLDSSSVLKSARDAAGALRDMEANAGKAGRSLAQLGTVSPGDRLRRDFMDLDDVLGAVTSRLGLAAVAFKALDLSRASVLDYR
jgi:hypothetical protein